MDSRVVVHLRAVMILVSVLVLGSNQKILRNIG